MGIIKCLNCGASVNDAAEGCPECGADPRTGIVPEHVKRWEETGDIWSEAFDLFDHYVAQVMAADLPSADSLLGACEARASTLLNLLPDVILQWRSIWEDVAPRIGRSPRLPSEDPNDGAALLALVVKALGEGNERGPGMYIVLGIAEAMTWTPLAGVADRVIGSDSHRSEMLGAQTRLAHQARALFELEYTRLRWRLDVTREPLDEVQQQRLTSVLDTVGPLLGGLGLQTTLAWCALNPGSHWEAEGASDPGAA